MDNPAYFADTINNGLFGGREIVKPENLKELDSKENAVLYDAFKKIVTLKKDRDNIKIAKFFKDDNVTYAIIGIENQTDVNYAMPVRTLLYDAMRYDKQIEAISNSYKKKNSSKGLSDSEFLSGIRKDDKIEPVITLTVYYGTKEWDGPLSLHDMFSDNVSPDILALVSDYHVNLLEPKKIKDWDNFKTDVGILFELISASDKKNGIRELVESYPERFSDVNNDIVRAVNFYTKCAIPVNELEENTNMCYAWESSMNEARDEGKDEIMTLFSWLKEAGRLDEAIAIMDKENESLRKDLFEEYKSTLTK